MQELQQIKQAQNNGHYLRLAFPKNAYDKIKFEKKTGERSGIVTWNKYI